MAYKSLTLLLAAATAASASKLLAAAQTSALLLKRPVSIVTFSGADRHRFLHGLCTADVTALSAATNQVADAAIVDPKGSMLSLLTVLDDAPAEELVAYCADDETIKGAKLASFFDRYIFPADAVEVQDASSSHGSCCYELVGPRACDILLQAAAASSDGAAAKAPAAGCATRLRLFDGEVDALVAGHSSLGYREGVSLLVLGASDGNTNVEAKLTELVEQCGGDVAPSYDDARILRGRPAIGREFGAGAAVEAVPPLSLGLWAAVAPDKGCYLGNEMLARLAKAKIQKRDLYGIALEGEESTSLEIGTEVKTAEGGDEDGSAAVLGVVTSSLPGFALALLKPAVAPIGTPVRCGSATGKVVDLPFATRQGSSGGGGDSDESDEEAADKAAKAAAEAERKAAKLAAMEAKLKALGLKK